MSVLSALYTELIYRPLLNGLVFFYTLLPYPDLGLAILMLTAVVRLLLHPALVQAVRSQQAMARIQPQLRAIQERFSSNREEQARRTMELYRTAGIHPLSGCLPVLIQLPVLIGLYQVFWRGIALGDASLLYPFVPSVAAFNPVAFGLVDLTARSVVLAIAAGASQFLYGRVVGASPAGEKSPAGDFMRAMQWQMQYFLPAFIAVISWSLPAALGFYWTIFNLFAIVEHRWIQRRLAHERNSRMHLPNP